MANNFHYDAGNAGDLIKHEWLLRVLDWLPKDGAYFDAFAGPPKHVLNPRVKNRLTAAPAELRLRLAQEEEMKKGYYLGSALLAWNHLGIGYEVRVFDENTVYAPWYEDCFGIPFEQIDDGYNALINREEQKKTLVLVDPYNFFRPDPEKEATDQANKQKVQINWTLIQSYPGPLLIFILNLDPNNSVGKAYAQALTNCSKHRLIFRAIVPPISGTFIKGEGKYFAEILYLPEKIDTVEQNWRGNSLKRGAEAVAQTLNLKFCTSNSPTYPPDTVKYIAP